MSLPKTAKKLCVRKEGLHMFSSITRSLASIFSCHQAESQLPLPTLVSNIYYQAPTRGIENLVEFDEKH